MNKRFPSKPAHPERICWGCDRYCAVDAMACGNGSVPTPHPSELSGDGWLQWGQDPPAPPASGGVPTPAPAPATDDTLVP